MSAVTPIFKTPARSVKTVKRHQFEKPSKVNGFKKHKKEKMIKQPVHGHPRQISQVVQSPSAEPSPSSSCSSSSLKKEKMINIYVRHGNYHNYYNFRHKDSRPEHFQEILPQLLDELGQIDKKYKDSKVLYLLDIGCNSGQLTKLILDVVLQGVKAEGKRVRGFGVDIDEELIEEAIKTHCSDGLTIEFAAADIWTVVLESTTNNPIGDYLKRKSIEQFDFVSCFSVLMYIHLNYGDDGLRQVLYYLCSVTKILVLELQPWKKYRDQERRMRRDGGGIYPLYETLGWRGEGILEQMINDYVIGQGFRIVCDQQKKNEFKRSIVVFARIKE